MTCRACGASVSLDARFCQACGTPVVRGCPACGGELPAEARFCPACGAPVRSGPPATGSGDHAQPAPARERKIATLLFADLVGFTSLGEMHDPEVVGALVGQVFERLSDEVTRYEGTIEKFAGDAMLAVFGVPSVHEDDPERAVRAGLEMQAAIVALAAEARAAGRPEPALRIGIETGEVLVDLARAGAQRDLFVTGDAVNVAARLQQGASPGAVVVGPSTWAATRHVVDYEELARTSLKGKADPVIAWRAIAVKARRSGQRAPLGLESPVVGRDEEIALLKETVRRTVADGRPHLVTVIGAPGAGKSRLGWELEKYLDGLPEIYHWRKGRCLAYGQASYSALADAIKSDARITDDEQPAAAEARLDERVAELHGAQADPAIGAALRSLLALGSDRPNLPREELFDAWRRHLDAVARVAPLVLVLEDIHWADEGLLDVIEFLARWGEGPVLVLCLARHELLERRPGWGGGLLNAATIVLEPLAGGEVGRLVDALLGSALPGALRERVVELADGNPLFAEELIRMFVDRGVVRFADGRWELAEEIDAVEVPGSVQAVLAARLDGLPAAEKRLAQTAAVVGRIFWDGLLAHLSRQGAPAVGDLLRRLRVKELVVPREPSSLAGSAEFGFRHVLIRDVAYDSLPKRDRASLHLDVAAWAEQALAGRSEEFVELLAAHYVAALRYQEEFNTDPAALRTLREHTYRQARGAAARAARLGQLDAATAWIRTAIEEARRLDLPAAEFGALILDYLEFAWGTESGSTAAPLVAEAVEGMERLASPSEEERTSLAVLRAQLGRTRYMGQDLAGARAALETGLAAEPPPVGRAMLLSALGWLEWRLGNHDRAIEPLETAVALAERHGADAIHRQAIHDLGVARSGRNDIAGQALIEHSFELAKAAGDENLLTRCYINLPGTMMALGQPPAVVDPIAEEGLQRSRRRIDRVAIAWLAANLAELRWTQGRTQQALALAIEAADAARSVGDRELLATKLVLVAVMRLWLGARDEAGRTLSAADEALARAEAQTRSTLVSLQAWLRWPDADAAIDAIVGAGPPGTLPNGVLAGLTLARLGLRADRPAITEQGRSWVAESVAGTVGPMLPLFARLAGALAAGHADATGDATGDAADVAERFLAHGMTMPAAEAFADAALLAARAGRPDTPWAARARELFEAAGAVPPLGDPAPTAVAPAS